MEDKTLTFRTLADTFTTVARDLVESLILKHKEIKALEEKRDSLSVEKVQRIRDEIQAIKDALEDVDISLNLKLDQINAYFNAVKSLYHS